MLKKLKATIAVLGVLIVLSPLQDSAQALSGDPCTDSYTVPEPTLTATSADEGIKLTWTDVPDTHKELQGYIRRYQIWRRIVGEQSSRYVYNDIRLIEGEVPNLIWSDETRSMVDDHVANGKTYEYAIQPVIDTGCRLIFVTYATPTAVTAKFTLVLPKAPSLTGTMAADNRSIELTVTAPSDGPVPHGFRVDYHLTGGPDEWYEDKVIEDSLLAPIPFGSTKTVTVDDFYDRLPDSGTVTVKYRAVTLRYRWPNGVWQPEVIDKSPVSNEVLFTNIGKNVGAQSQGNLPQSNNPSTPPQSITVQPPLDPLEQAQDPTPSEDSSTQSSDDLLVSPQNPTTQPPLDTPAQQPQVASRSITHTGKIAFSEIMYESKGGDHAYPQWIELHNTSNIDALDLTGWVLTMETMDEGKRNHAYQEITLNKLIIPPHATALIVPGTGRNDVNLPEDRIYNISEQHNPIARMFGDVGFYLELTDVEGSTSDRAGNMDGKHLTKDTPIWKLPPGKIEVTKDRISIMRKYSKTGDLTPLDGTKREHWASSGHIFLRHQFKKMTYYGQKRDIGNPGFRDSNRPLPVTLSHFRVEATETAGVLLNWTTQSELQNAGFNVLRGISKEGHFTKINPTLIPGAGTTGKRNDYQWTDTTAQSDVPYFYRIQDVSLAGEVTTVATKRLTGVMSAKGKKLISWGDLKKER